MYKNIKRFSALFLALLMLLTPVLGQAEAREISIYINDVKLETPDKPYIKESRTLVPIRIISENLGIEVGWDNTNREVLLQNGDDNIILPIEKDYYLVNGEKIATEISGELKESRTFVPVRLIAELYGKAVTWDQNTWSVYISDEKGTDTLEKSPVARVVAGDTKPVNKGKVEEESRSSNRTSPGEFRDAKDPAYLYSEGRIIGNKNSMIFHIPSGRDYKKVSVKNAVFFDTKEEAIAAGYRQAQR